MNALWMAVSFVVVSVSAALAEPRELARSDRLRSGVQANNGSALSGGRRA